MEGKCNNQCSFSVCGLTLFNFGPFLTVSAIHYPSKMTRIADLRTNFMVTSLLLTVTYVIPLINEYFMINT